MDIRSRTKYAVLGNPVLRRVGLSLLNSPRVTGNRLYNLAHARQMRSVIQDCQLRPQLVTVELTNACNLRCTFCPNKDMERPRGFMVDTFYRGLIDQCVSLGVKDLCLSGTGEPMLHGQLSEFIGYAKTRGIETVALITNGTLMSRDVSRELVRVGVDLVRVSIDAATVELYRELKPPGELSAVLSNADGLRCERGNRNKPTIVAKFMVEAGNKGELAKFKRDWEPLVDKLLITFPHNWGGHVNVKASEQLRGNSPCAMPFRHLVVLWDGRVPLCCLDGEGEMVLGNLRKSTLGEVWQGEAFQSVRESHLRGETNSLPLCRSCSFRDPWWGY